jgi:hypothetical protein
LGAQRFITKGTAKTFQDICQAIESQVGAA